MLYFSRVQCYNLIVLGNSDSLSISFFRSNGKRNLTRVFQVLISIKLYFYRQFIPSLTTFWRNRSPRWSLITRLQRCSPTLVTTERNIYLLSVSFQVVVGITKRHLSFISWIIVCHCLRHIIVCTTYYKRHCTSKHQDGSQ